jgi:hypothetical protein
MTVRIPSGARLTPERINALAPLYARKTADQSIASSATLTNDPVLLIPNLVAGAVYELWLHVLYRAAASGAIPGLKVDFVVPAGAAITGAAFDASGATGATASNAAVGNGAVGGIQAPTSNGLFREGGLLVMGATDGTLQFRWAQNTANASATTVASGSYLRLTRVD